jgi:D-arginine dehydrogenase
LEIVMTICYDAVVIGAGLIGASAACHLAKSCKVALIEQESRPGYHSSGRSAAVLLPTYGGPLARALTAASSRFLTNPPDGFTHFPLTAPRGAIFLAAENQLSQLDAWCSESGSASSEVRMLSAAEVVRRVPILNSEAIAAALLLPEVKDIDAAALLQGYLKMFRARDGALLLDSRASAIDRDAGVWRIVTGSGEVRAKTIVNAAGAWADEIGNLAGVTPKGFMPTRRTMVVVDGPEGVDVRPWPLVADAGETFYFKPDGARLVVSPADQSEVAAHDVQPEEWDVAVAVERVETLTHLRVRRVEHRWAGLRTFAPDDEPVIGFDPQTPDFLWAAGFGGFGVQSAHAAGHCCEALIRGAQLPALYSELGVDLERLSPRRLAPRGVTQTMNQEGV